MTTATRKYRGAKHGKQTVAHRRKVVYKRRLREAYASRLNKEAAQARKEAAAKQREEQKKLWAEANAKPAKKRSLFARFFGKGDE